MEDIILNNSITGGAVIAALLIFLGSYGFILSEKIDRTVVSIFGAVLMVLAGIVFNFYNQDLAVEKIDFNTIGLLVGMMVIVSILKDTGFFQYIAIKSAKFAKGKPVRIMIIFSLITALFSALLDNVTTVLLMAPMTIVICDNLRINPIPFLLSEIFMSNIGGTGTLIGDPPNILIGSAAGLSFMDFVVNLAPVVFLISAVVMLVLVKKYRHEIKASEEYVASIMRLNENDSIKNVKLLKKSLFVLVLVIFAFCLHGVLHIESATIAIFGAALLLLLDQQNPEKALHEVEWTTIFFFIGLFVLVGGIAQVGVISWITDKLLYFTNGSLSATAYSMLWGGAFFSAFVNNIPFVATVILMVQDMGTTFPNLDPIWWSLALGVCLGGNGTLIGASANLAVAGIAEKAGYKISFKEFAKMGFFITFISIVISHIYIWFFYL